MAWYKPGQAREKRRATSSESSPEGRWRSYEYADLIKRDKINLDLFRLKDTILEDSDDLPEPENIAQEIADDLQTALEQFQAIAAALKK